MIHLIFITAVLVLAVLSKPVQAADFPVKALVGVFPVNTLADVVSKVYEDNFRLKFTPFDHHKAQGEAEASQISGAVFTKISINFFNLEPNQQYLAVYHYNGECETEIKSVENVIEGAFFADESGTGSVEDQVRIRISKINSISLRNAKNFKEVIACARTEK